MNCAIEDCSRRKHCRGWCEMHYQRWRRTGTPYGVGRLGRPRKVIKYGTVHSWLKRDRGPARNHPCVECGGLAEEWAYVGGAPDERTSELGCAYTPDLAYYVAKCVPCHRAADWVRRRVTVPQEIVDRWLAGEVIASLAREFGFHRVTLSRHLNKLTERPKGVVKA